MDRREFLVLAGMAPLGTGLRIGRSRGEEVTAPRGEDAFEVVQVKGSYREIGYQVGRAFRERISTLLERRRSWHDGLLGILETRPGRNLSMALREHAKRSFPHLVEELEGMADGAGVAFPALWAITVNSELRGSGGMPAGCSTLVVGRRWLFHNEDFTSAYDGLMLLLRISPPSGVSFFSLTYPGIISGNGPSFNDHGVVETTNYISCTKAEPGLPRYIIGRAILEAKSLQEAIQVASLAPRAHPYHFNLAGLGERRYASVEVTPEAVRVHEPSGVFAHTNHLVHHGTRGFAAEDMEYVKTSSLPRYETLVVGSGSGGDSDTPEEALALMSSHRYAPYSVCRHPQGEVRGQTMATAYVDLEVGRFRLYQGNPCEAVVRGRYRDCSF